MLRRLSPRAEWLLINLVCFGPFAALSLHGLLQRQSSMVFDDRRALTVVGIELVAGTIAVLILRARGWTLADLGFRVSVPLTIAGLVLVIVANVAIAGFYQLFVLASGTDPAAATTVVPRVSWVPLLLMLAIDPLYEETLEVAYNVRALEGSGAAFAITFSAAVRMVCHAWQGPIVPLTILPLGLIFAAVYWKWRRVWPLVVAHGFAGYVTFAPQ